jgi:hypothetical protein
LGCSKVLNSCLVLRAGLLIECSVDAKHQRLAPIRKHVLTLDLEAVDQRVIATADCLRRFYEPNTAHAAFRQQAKERSPDLLGFRRVDAGPRPFDLVQLHPFTPRRVAIDQQITLVPPCQTMTAELLAYVRLERERDLLTHCLHDGVFRITLEEVARRKQTQAERPVSVLSPSLQILARHE